MFHQTAPHDFWNSLPTLRHPHRCFCCSPPRRAIFLGVGTSDPIWRPLFQPVAMHPVPIIYRLHPEFSAVQHPSPAPRISSDAWFSQYFPPHRNDLFFLQFFSFFNYGQKGFGDFIRCRHICSFLSYTRSQTPAGHMINAFTLLRDTTAACRLKSP